MSNDFLGSLGTGLSDFATALGGGTQPVANPVQAADTSSAVNSAVNPATVAQADITSGQNAPAQTQNQNQQGQTQTPQQQQNQPQSAFDQIKKALTNLKQQQQQGNPWQIGGPTQLPAAPQPPPLKLGHPAPTPANPADLPSPNAQETMLRNVGAEGAGGEAEYGFDIPPGGEGESNVPEYGPDNIPPEVQGPPKPEYQGPNVPYPEGPSFDQEYGPGRPAQSGWPAGWQDTQGNQVGSARSSVPASQNPAAGGMQSPSGGQTAAGGAPSPGQVTFPAGQPIPSQGSPWYGPFRRTFKPGMGPIPDAIWQAVQPDPLQQATGVEAPRTLGRSPSGPAKPQDEKGYRPEDDPSFQKPSVTKAPVTGKPIETVDPKTKKPVSPTTGDPVPKKSQPPAKDQTPYPTTRGEGPIMRDARGGLSVPPLLGELAMVALPLMIMGLLGRKNHFRVGGGFGHPGGFGGRNYWTLAHNYPGNNWLLPGLALGGAGGLALGGLSGQGQQGQHSGQQSGDLGLAAYNPYYDKQSRYANPGTPSSTVTGTGPNGQALPYTGQQVADFTDYVANQLGEDPAIVKQVLAGESSYGQNYTNDRERDGIPSYGPFQLHDSGPGSVGYEFKKATGLDARDPSTWKDQIVFALKWAQTHGWGPWGAATKAGIPQWAGIDRNSGKRLAWSYGKPNGGVTMTGGSREPNPEGNAPPQTTQQGPEGVASVM